MEGEGKATKSRASKKTGGISEEFSWMKDTRWNWNNWREVIFRADGSFLAPAENCERQGNPQCKWYTDEDRIYVRCVRASGVRACATRGARVCVCCVCAVVHPGSDRL